MHLFVFMLGLVAFFLAGLGVPEHPRMKYIGWGLFLWALSTALTI